MKKDELIVFVLFVIIIISGFIGMCLRAEQIDNKKELSNSAVTSLDNSVTT